MKKLLLILLCLPFLFTTCKKEEDEPSNNGQVNTIKDIGYGINNSEVFKTTDGGKNWIKMAYKPFTNLDVLSEYIVYGTNNMSLFKSVDGGSSWDLIENPFYIKEIDFISEDLGFCIQDGFFMDSVNGVLYDGNIIFKTSNGGTTWNMLSPIYDINGVFMDDLRDIDFISEDLGYCISRGLFNSPYYIIYKTIDGGLTWDATDEIYNYDDFDFISENIGYYNDNNYIYKTTDSGLTWEIVDEISFYDFDFISENVGFGSNNYGVWKTIDGGLTWDTLSTMPLNPIAFGQEVNK